RLPLYRHGPFRQAAGRACGRAAPGTAAAQLPGLLDAARVRSARLRDLRDRPRRPDVRPEPEEPGRILRGARCGSPAGLARHGIVRRRPGAPRGDPGARLSFPRLDRVDRARAPGRLPPHVRCRARRAEAARGRRPGRGAAGLDRRHAQGAAAGARGVYGVRPLPPHAPLARQLFESDLTWEDEMNEAIRILRNEHRSISSVLHALRELAQTAQDPAVRPEFAVFRAMIYYIDTFPERLHHPKENDVLFPRILIRSPAAASLVQRLRDEHEKGAALIRELERSLLAFEVAW